MSDLARKRLEHELADAKPLYTKGEALAEASRCLYCHDAPCIPACPTGIDIPTFIRKISTGNVKGAARTILNSNILGYSCARVCPVEVLCAGSCVYNEWGREPIQIGRLQRSATDGIFQNGALDYFQKKAATGKTIAMVGGGPASLSCAAYLSIEGHSATIFEKNAFLGGLNTTGVAPYKLHAEDALKEVEFVRSLGVEIKTGVQIGKEISAKKLLSDYDAVFLGLGLGEDTRLSIPGEEAEGVIGATHMIYRLKLDPKFQLGKIKKAIVVGGGNTAIDAARELAQLGVKNVAVVYRRSLDDMPGYEHEWDAAKLEGVIMIENALPVSFESGGGRAKSIQLAHCNEGKATKGGEWFVEADLFVVAIGQRKMQDLATQFDGVACDSKGCVIVDKETGQTGNPKVYSGGDCINGGKEVVNAVADGKKTAMAIHKMLMGENDGRSKNQLRRN